MVNDLQFEAEPCTQFIYLALLVLVDKTRVARTEHSLMVLNQAETLDQMLIKNKKAEQRVFCNVCSPVLFLPPFQEHLKYKALGSHTVPDSGRTRRSPSLQSSHSWYMYSTGSFSQVMQYQWVMTGARDSTMPRHSFFSPPSFSNRCSTARPTSSSAPGGTLILLFTAGGKPFVYLLMSLMLVEFAHCTFSNRITKLIFQKLAKR